MTIPPPREHDPQQRAAEGTAIPPARAPLRGYPLTSAYLCVCVTLILLAVLFEWRL